MFTVEQLSAAVLVGILVYFSLDFQKSYSTHLHALSVQPLARFLAGFAVALCAAYNPLHGALAFLIVFFWIADIHLLSSRKLITQ